MTSLYLGKIMSYNNIPKNTQYFMILESRVLNFNSCRVETLMANIEFYHIRGLYSGLRIFIPTYRHCMVESSYDLVSVDTNDGGQVLKKFSVWP